MCECADWTSKYLTSNFNRSSKFKPERWVENCDAWRNKWYEWNKWNKWYAPRRSHPKSIMVWVAFSSKGFLQPIFVPPQVKINYDYYIKYILKPLKKTGDELFGYGKWIFHQDSAPAHTAKKTVKFLKESKINVIKPSEWIPNSPDCAPCDFWLS